MEVVLHGQVAAQAPERVVQQGKITAARFLTVLLGVQAHYSPFVSFWTLVPSALSIALLFIVPSRALFALSVGIAVTTISLRLLTERPKGPLDIAFGNVTKPRKTQTIVGSHTYRLKATFLDNHFNVFDPNTHRYHAPCHRGSLSVFSHSCLLPTGKGALRSFSVGDDGLRGAVNAATAAKVVAWLERRRAKRAPAVALTPRRDLAVIAVPDPSARAKCWATLPETCAATEQRIGNSNALFGRVGHQFFAHTEHAKNTLLREGVKSSDIAVAGNAVIGALLQLARREQRFDESSLRALENETHSSVLVTAHRRESFGEQFESMCVGRKQLASSYRDEIMLVYPVHRNPNARSVVGPASPDLDNVLPVDPLDYLPFVHLLKPAYVVLTDYGGIQNEASSLGKPALVMRDVTERQDSVDAGTVWLVGTNAPVIMA
jgi:hypothetical protein